MGEAFVGASVEDGGKEGLLFVVVFGEQIGVGRGEEGAPVDAIGLA